jgi:hypothetical protein
MPDSFEDQSWAKFGVAAALSHEYAKDQRFFLELLVKTLQSALPDETEVAQRGVFKKSFASVTVTLGDNRYTFEDPGKGAVKATRTHVVRGIALKNEPVAVEEALAEMGQALEQKMANDAKAREALAAMLGLP